MNLGESFRDNSRSYDQYSSSYEEPDDIGPLKKVKIESAFIVRNQSASTKKDLHTLNPSLPTMLRPTFQLSDDSDSYQSIYLQESVEEESLYPPEKSSIIIDCDAEQQDETLLIYEEKPFCQVLDHSSSRCLKPLKQSQDQKLIMQEDFQRIQLPLDPQIQQLFQGNNLKSKQFHFTLKSPLNSQLQQKYPPSTRNILEHRIIQDTAKLAKLVIQFIRRSIFNPEVEQEIIMMPLKDNLIHTIELTKMCSEAKESIIKLFNQGVPLDENYRKHKKIRLGASFSNNHTYVFHPTYFQTSELFNHILRKGISGQTFLYKNFEGTGKSSSILLITKLTEFIMKYLRLIKTQTTPPQQIRKIHQYFSQNSAKIVYITFDPVQMQELTQQKLLLSIKNQLHQKFKKGSQKYLSYDIPLSDFKDIDTFYFQHFNTNLVLIVDHIDLLLKMTHTKQSMSLKQRPQIQNRYHEIQKIKAAIRTLIGQFQTSTFISSSLSKKQFNSFFRINGSILQAIQVNQCEFQQLLLFKRRTICYELIDKFMQNERHWFMQNKLLDKSIYSRSDELSIKHKLILRKVLTQKLSSQYCSFMTPSTIRSAFSYHSSKKQLKFENHIQKLKVSSNPILTDREMFEISVYNLKKIIQISKNHLKDRLNECFLNLIKKDEFTKIFLAEAYYQIQNELKKSSSKISQELTIKSPIQGMSLFQNTQLINQQVFLIKNDKELQLLFHPLLILEILSPFIKKFWKEEYFASKFFEKIQNMTKEVFGVIVQELCINSLISGSPKLILNGRSFSIFQYFFTFESIKEKYSFTSGFMTAISYIFNSGIKIQKNQSIIFLPTKTSKVQIMKTNSYSHRVQYYDFQSPSIDMSCLRIRQERKQIQIKAFDFTISLKNDKYTEKIVGFLNFYKTFSDRNKKFREFNQIKYQVTLSYEVLIMEQYESKNLKRYASNLVQKLNSIFSELKFKMKEDYIIVRNRKLSMQLLSSIKIISYRRDVNIQNPTIDQTNLLIVNKIYTRKKSSMIQNSSQIIEWISPVKLEEYE